MPVDSRLADALRPFGRRAALVAFVRAWLASVIAASLVAEIAFLLGFRSGLGLVVLAGATVLAGVVIAARQRPTPLALARRIDTRARLNDLVVTAIGCETEGMPAVVRRAGIDALARETPRAIFPFEPPAHWRRWLAAAAATQMIAIPLAVRAPAARPAQNDLTSLALPAAASPTAPARNENPNPPSQAPANAASPQMTQSTTGAAGARIDPSSAPRPGAADARASGAGNDDRLRIAARNAYADITAGRVPLAKRDIVEKYFAAIQGQKERHR